MAKKTRLKGIQDVTQGLNAALAQIRGKSKKGLIEASIIIRRDMEKTSPTIPIDTGNLRASWFSVIGKGNVANSGGFKGKDAGKEKALHSQAIAMANSITQSTINPVIILGFSASYAEAVHERIDSKIQYNKQGSGAKFFESALYRNKDLILQTIKQNVRK
jgi:hypothetical protein